VDWRADVPRATLTIHYINKSSGTEECIAGSRYEDTYEQMMQGCYWDYVRVYVPRGSRLLGVVGSDRTPEVSEEEGKTVFSAFLVIAPGAARTLTFHYQLSSPPLPILSGRGVGGEAQSPAERSYRFLFQKQPGTANIPVQMSITGRTLLFDPGQSDPVTVDEAGRVRFELAGDTRLTWVEPEAGGVQNAWAVILLGVVGLFLILLGVVTW
ncbi:MAG: hypothetical protein H5U03_09260, partial [Clostridia bacterium]|nr:hypothetical protein [Clostridia bacterium]